MSSTEFLFIYIYICVCVLISMYVFIPHLDVRYQEKSCHHHNDVGRCTEHLGRHRKPLEFRCHGAHPKHKVG